MLTCLTKSFARRAARCALQPAYPRTLHRRHAAQGALGVLHEDLDSALERLVLGSTQLRAELEGELRRSHSHRLPPASEAQFEHATIQTARSSKADGRSCVVEPVKLFHAWAENPLSIRKLPQATVSSLLDESSALLEQLPGPLLELGLPRSGQDPKLVVVGDTHGQLLDVLHILHQQGPPSADTVYLFNGDIADRGPQAVEIWLLLLSFMLRAPGSVHILRGNHENRALNERSVRMGGGFADECLSKYGQEVYDRFQRLFMLLPLFAVIEQEVFVVHAGLFRFEDVTLDTLRALPYRRHFPDPPLKDSPAARQPNWGWTDEEIMLFDAQWADPREAWGIGTSKRGTQCMTFGPNVTEDFLKSNDLSLCIRSHQVPRTLRGFDVTHQKRLLTVFSASNYTGSGNRGAVAILRADTTRDLGRELVLPGLRKLWVECIEHDLVRGDGRWLNSAKAVAQVAKELGQGSVRSAGSVACEAARHALAIMCLEREELWTRCRELDEASTSQIPKATFLHELEKICGELRWESLLQHCGLNLGPEVAYGEVLDAVEIRWQYLDASQAQILASAMLEAELHLDGFVALFDANYDGLVTLQEFQLALRRLLPGLSAAELTRFGDFLGQRAGEKFSLGEVIENLLLFAPPMHLKEPWMHEMLPKVRSDIESWAERQAMPGKHALLKFFREFDENSDGILSVEELVNGILSIERTNSQSLDEQETASLAEALDTNGSGGISFLEMCRGLQPAGRSASRAQALKLAAQCSCTALMFVHREALLHGCQLLDASGTGHVAAADFAAVVAALGNVAGRQLTQRQLEALEQQLDSDNVPYRTALDHFDIKLREPFK